MRVVTDITGLRYGRLTVIEGPFKRIGHEKTFWLCACDCGKEILCRKSAITSGNTKSCGCIRDDISYCQVGIRKVKPIFDDGRTEFRFVHHRRTGRDEPFSLWSFDEAEARRLAVIGSTPGEVEFVGIR